MKYFPLIWRNLLRRKVRTIFTLASVFIALPSPSFRKAETGVSRSATRVVHTTCASSRP